MKNKILIVAGVIVLFLIIKTFIHSDEKLITELINNITNKASFVTQEEVHPFVLLEKGKVLANHFSESTVIEVEFEGDIHTKIFGQDEILKRYTLARNHLDSLTVKFDKLDIDVNKDQAIVKTTIIVGLVRKGFDEEELYAEPVTVTVDKTNGEWLVAKIRNVQLLQK